MKGILTYHSIDDTGSPISVSREAFARHARFLGSGAVRVVPLAELATVPDDEDALAVTFDDGFENLATVAWPQLRDGGVPATVFVVTDRIGRDNRWGDADEEGIPSLPLMDWEMLGRFSEEGLEVGSHTRTHPRLATVPAERVQAELEGSRDDIAARIGAPATSFCYPYGSFDENVAAAARRTYARACTTRLAPVPDGADPHLLPRLDAYYLQGAGRLESFGTGAFRRYVQGRWLLRGVRNRARRLLAGRGA